MADQSKITGIVLSIYPVGESDRRLTILTAQRGRMQVFARGCRKVKSPLHALAQPLVAGEFIISESRTYAYLVSGEGKDFYPELKEDLDSIYYSTYFAEVAEYFTVEGQDERPVLNLLYVTFSAMKKKLVPLQLIRRIYELKMLQIQGMGMECFHCLACGKDKDLVRISFEDGGLYCGDCGGSHFSRDISPKTVYALQYVMASGLERLYAFRLDEETQQEFLWAADHYFTVQADHRFRSAAMLDFL